MAMKRAERRGGGQRAGHEEEEVLVHGEEENRGRGSRHRYMLRYLDRVRLVKYILILKLHS